MAPSTFARLVHGDWSTKKEKRWAAEALRTPIGWSVAAPRLVGPTDRFVVNLLEGRQPTLAGFDFPIGLPAEYGRHTGFADFSDAIAHLGSGAWDRFYDVADVRDEISLQRPFYPRVPSPATRPGHLLAALGAEDMNVLRRQCRRRPTAGGSCRHGRAGVGGVDPGTRGMSGPAQGEP